MHFRYIRLPCDPNDVQLSFHSSTSLALWLFSSKPYQWIYTYWIFRDNMWVVNYRKYPSMIQSTDEYRVTLCLAGQIKSTKNYWMWRCNCSILLFGTRSSSLFDNRIGIHTLEFSEMLPPCHRNVQDLPYLMIMVTSITYSLVPQFHVRLPAAVEWFANLTVLATFPLPIHPQDLLKVVCRLVAGYAIWDHQV